MKIRFTALNNQRGQEHFEFDTNTLQTNETLEKFILSTENDGTIFITPMITDGGSQYPFPCLEPIK